MTYEELEEVIHNIFAAQGRTVSEKIVSVWVKEIFAKGFYDEASSNRTDGGRRRENNFT